MKKINRLLLAGIIICTSLPVIAQDDYSVQDSVVKKENIAIKWSPASIYFGKISMHGEISIRPKRSITIGLGIPVDHQEDFTINDDRQVLTTQTLSVMGGYRMYLGKKPMSGLYFEPYLKYLKNDTESFIFTDLDNDPVIFRGTSRFNTAGLGAQLGVQFLIAKRITLDFFFLGPEANTSRISFEARDISSSTWTPQDAEDAEREIREVLEDIPFIGKKVKVNVDATTRRVTADYKGFLPGLRGGITIGVRF